MLPCDLYLSFVISLYVPPELIISILYLFRVFKIELKFSLFDNEIIALLIFFMKFYLVPILYSDFHFDIAQATSPDGRLIFAPEDTVFEIKYPGADIIGTVK